MVTRLKTIGLCMAIALVAIGTADVRAAQGELIGKWTVLDPVNALGPIKPNGTWTEDGQAIVATGSAAPWTIRTAGEASWTDYKLTAKVTVRKPGPKLARPVRHWEFDRYLPRAWFPPGEHTGQYRFRYYAGEFDWGSDAAVFVRYQDRENCYRVQLSTEYQELILWHGTGGYLQVVPCKLEPGKTYAVDVVARGRQIQVFVDGVKKIDYWHRTFPTLAGKVGLGAYRSTVAFAEVTVTPVPPAEGVLQPHRPQLTTRTWRALRWIFDGNEPICMMAKMPKELGGGAGTLSFHQVKLRPGYRPQIWTQVTIWPGYAAQRTILVGEADQIKTDGEGTDALDLTFATEDTSGVAHADHTDRVTFDRVRGTYRHAMTVKTRFLKDRTIGTFEFFDPFIYNNKEPGRGVKSRWLPAGHQWGLLGGEGETIYRHPISQSLNMPYQNNWHPARKKSFWLLYPDRAACPMWKTEVVGDDVFEMGVCHWGYDYHQRVRWPKQRKTFKAGDRITVHFTMTGYPLHEAEAMFRKSVLHPIHNKLVKARNKRSEQGSAPDGFAFPVCDPAGTDFTRLANIREPFIGWPFRGKYTLDTAVGHGDSYSLRMDGAAEVNGLMYHHMIEPAAEYLCTFWLKTEGVNGDGPTVKLSYSYANQTPADTIRTGLTGDNDWVKFSFVTKVPIITFDTYDSSTLVLTTHGEGQVWLDDFSLRPLAPGEANDLPDSATLTHEKRKKKP